MSISHRSNRLKLVGTPSVEQLQNGRYKLTVTCSTMNSREDWYSANKARIFPDFGSLQSAEMSIDGLAPRTGEAYADMRLTQVESGNRSGMGQVGDYNVSLTYETLGSAFVQVKDDNTDYELNGLRRVTRTSIAEAGTDYDKTVGTSFIDHQIDAETAVRCFLASYAIDDTDSFRQVQEVYIEPGQISISEESGPQGIPNTKVRRYTSQITEPTSLGITLSRSKENTSGYTIYNYSFLEGGTVGSSPVTADGEVISYAKNIQVRQAGVVGRNVRTVTGGEISFIYVVPPSVKDVQATISIKLVTSSAISLPVAYNLSGISCSASIVTSRKTPIGIEQGSTITASVFNRSYSANARSFPNSYHTGGGTSSVTTPAQILRDDDSIIGEALDETTTTSVTMSGSQVAPATTGVYQDEVDPAFLDADGTQYYRRTTYTI